MSHPVRDKHMLTLKDGQVIRVTRMSNEWGGASDNLIGEGETAWWGIWRDEGLDWVTPQAKRYDLMVDKCCDDYVVYNEDEIPDEFFVLRAKYALLGE